MTTRERLVSEIPSEGYEVEIIRDFSEMDLDLVRDIIDFWSRQTKEDVYFRFFAGNPPCEAAFCSILKNYEAIVAIYSNDDSGRRLVGYAEAGRDRYEPEWFELGVAVDVSHRKQGLARKLIEILGENRQSLGLRKVKATVLAGNQPMVKLIQKLGEGSKVSKRYSDGCLEYRIETP